MKTIPAPNLRGFVDGLHRGYLSGWAWSSDRPDERLEIEVLESGTLMATGTADLFRSDLLSAGVGDGKYAFHIMLPSSLFDGAEHLLIVREKGSGQPIAPEFTVRFPRLTLAAGAARSSRSNQPFIPAQNNQAKAEPLYDGPLGGNIDTTRGAVVLGWAWFPDRPKERADVELLDENGAVVARGRASRFRSDLAENSIGDGFHAFAVTVPVDRMRHGELKVTGRIFGTREELPGGPVRVRAPTQSGNLLINRATGLVFDNEVPLAPEFMIPATYLDSENPFPTLAPMGEISFVDNVPGEGWTQPLPAHGGRSIGTSGEALLRLSHLPVKHAALNLLLRGPRQTAQMLEIWLDQQRLITDLIALPDEQDLVLLFRLPSPRPVRTLVTLRFVLRGRLSNRRDGGGLMFRRLLFSK